MPTTTAAGDTQTSLSADGVMDSNTQWDPLTSTSPPTMTRPSLIRSQPQQLQKAASHSSVNSQRPPAMPTTSTDLTPSSDGSPPMVSRHQLRYPMAPGPWTFRPDATTTTTKHKPSPLTTPSLMVPVKPRATAHFQVLSLSTMRPSSASMMPTINTQQKTAPVPLVLGQIVATDADANETLRYQILGAPIPGLIINEQTGQWNFNTSD